MDLTNSTTNQHYLSQAEQRLNTLNPQAKPHRQRIYSFEVVDRKGLGLRLENSRGRLISQNLAITDLFSFDVASDKKSRLNFESLFARHESPIKSTTFRLLGRLEGMGTRIRSELVTVNDPGLYQDLMELFTAKILNFARNPHSIQKVLNTLGTLANYVPTAPTKLQHFERIINGRKPHQRRLCAELGITDDDYVKWLKVLFMLFVEYDKENNSMLSGLVKGIFESPQHAIAVLVGTYDAPSCLVSDRAFSTNIRQDGIDAFDFNLCSRAFIRYTFGNVGALVPHAPRALVEAYKRPARELSILYPGNDLGLLASFNKNVISQSAQRVYSATKGPFIV